MKDFSRIVIGVILLGATFLLVQRSSKPASLPLAPTSVDMSADENVDFTASFTIITGSVTRNFNAAMYHNLSPDAYIESVNPTVVHVKKKGATWDDFFQTLPFTLTKDCLTTGTKEILCTGQNGTLRFFLNDLENPDLLDEEIHAGDRVLIRFST